MKFQTAFLLFILVFIVIVVFQTFTMQNDRTVLEGLEPVIWDISQIEKIHKKHRFTVDDPPIDIFIQKLVDAGLSYSETSKRDDNFPSRENGVCMQDWDYGNRTIRADISRAQSCSGTGPCAVVPDVIIPRASATFNPFSRRQPSRQPPKSLLYDKCKERAINANATVFGLQAGNYCLYGNTPELALGEVGDPTNANRTPSRTDGQCNQPPYPNGNGAAWRQMVYAKPLRTTRMFNNYDQFVTDLVNANYTTSRSVVDALNANKLFFNNRSGFTTMKEGATDMNSMSKNKLVTLDDIVRFVNQQQKADALDGDVITSLDRLGYSYTVGQKPALFAKIDKYGISYIKTLKSFQINDENTANSFFAKLRELHPHERSLAHELLFIVALKEFLSLDVHAFIPVNGAQTETPWLTNTIKKYELDKLQLPMFPSTSPGDNLTENVLFKFKNIGVSPRDIDSFCNAFTSKNVKMSDFFTNIYPVLSGPNSKINYNYKGMDDLKTMIDDYISPINPSDLSNAFKSFNGILESLKLDSYQSYISFMPRLVHTVGPSSNLRDLLGLFNAYFPSIAYSDNPDGLKDVNDRIANKDLAINANTIFSEFIDKIPGYFSACNADFNAYLNLITTRNYTIKSIQRDTALGATYCRYMSNTPNPSAAVATAGFTTLDREDEPSKYFGRMASKLLNYVFSAGKQLLGYQRDGFDTPPQPPDNVVLTAFGIINYDTQLSGLENTLLGKYGFQNWSDLMSFIDPLSKLIQFDYLPNYINVMIKFGARTKNDWTSITTSLAGMKINDYANITEFLSIISSMGVNFNNFPEFSDKMIQFKADLRSSPPALQTSAIRVFCKDMTDNKFRYDDAETKQKINNIIDYFVTIRYDLQSYASSFPHLMVVAMISYDSSTKSPYPNQLYDIAEGPHLIQALPKGVNWNQIVEQAYFIASNTTATSIILNNDTNITRFVAFLYPTELQVLKSKAATRYSNKSERLRLMNDISLAMNKLAIEYNENDSLVDFYSKMSYLTKTFPFLMFEYLHQLISTKCPGGECKFPVKDPTDVKYSNYSSSYRTTNTAPATN
jgi:hypothetical protein